MKIKPEVLIDDLIERTRGIMNQAEGLLQHSDEELNYKPISEQWSALECIEHLNRYGDFYIPEINKRIQGSMFSAVEDFRSGWLGNYFANSMLPKPGMSKMKTFTSMNPLGSDLDKSVIDYFINMQRNILSDLNNARKVNLSKTKTSISISKWIKLKLGDTFRIVIYHNERHMVQARKAIMSVSSK